MVELCGWGCVGSHIMAFEEWDLTENIHSSQMPHRLCDDYQLKRSESCSFTLRGMFPPELEAAARHRCTHSAGIRQLDGMDSDLNCFMLSVDDNTEFRSRCVCLCTLA